MALALTVAIAAGVFAITPAAAQSPQMADKLMAIKTAQDANKAKLAQYTWTETETIGIKGSTKDTKVYQVSMVNGQQQKTQVANEAAQPSGRQGRLKEHVVDKKKQEYQEYGQSIGALAKQYTTPNPEALMAAKQAGNISLVPGSGTVNSYLNDPTDAVTISAQFAKLPDGTNHVATTAIDGVSKQLTVNDVNSNYQKQ